jgi:hypothetical protein
LHPGKVAKKAVEAQAKADGEENRVAVKLGNKALRAAMTLWQDEYRGLSSNGTENLHKVFMHHRHRRLMGHAMV